MALRHFLSLNDFTADELEQLVYRAIELKAMHRANTLYEPLRNKVLGMVFEKSSTRTRVSLEAGMAQFGGHAIFLSPRDTQLGRGEPIEDTAKVLSRMVDIITIRTFEHEKLELFAANSQVPVINALTDLYHPCQLLADIQTYYEHCGPIQGKIVAWIGDGNNMCHSYINAAKIFNFKLKIYCPEAHKPVAGILASAEANVEMTLDPTSAATGADIVVTDVWSSMGQEQEQTRRKEEFSACKITPEIMAVANSDSIFMHCLPTHRGEEVSASVIDGNQSVVWEEAENRLHSQKALLEFLLK